MQFITENVLAKVSSMTCAIKQLDCKQDSAFIGTHIASGTDDDMEDFDWMINADGHGSKIVNSHRVSDYSFQRQFDALDKDALVMAKDPIAYIDEHIKYESYNYIAGSTLQIVRIYREKNGKEIRVEYFGIGDSGMRIFDNGKLVAENTPHKIDDPAEKLRMSNRIDGIKYITNDSYTLFVNTPECISMAPCKRVKFYKQSQLFAYNTMELGLSMTQSIGHHGYTGYNPEIRTFHFPVSNDLQIVIASDGVFDIMNDKIAEDFAILCHSKTADELVEFAETRWKQEWINVDHDTCKPFDMPVCKVRIPDYDDISACIWRYS